MSSKGNIVGASAYSIENTEETSARQARVSASVVSASTGAPGGVHGAQGG